MPDILSPSELSQSLAVPDLTDSNIVPDHGLQKLIRLARRSLTSLWGCHVQTLRSSPIVPIEDNYDRLNYPPDGAARDARYTRYVTARYVLRTQTSAAIPDALSGQHGQPPANWLLMVPGMVYRRDSIDRWHCAEPHQLDLWRIVDHREHRVLNEPDLQMMMNGLMSALLPGHEWRTIASPHPYTHQGVQIDVRWEDRWLEVGECGLIHPKILQAAALNHHSGLAMGLGLDRILMVRKNLPDIRLIRARDPRIQEQMNDLSRYRPVSNQPVAQRDLSVVLDAGDDLEVLGDRVRRLCPEAGLIESLEVLSKTDFNQLPPQAIERLGIRHGQTNVLLRLKMRALDQTLTSAQANAIRNRVYQILNKGSISWLAEDSGKR